MHILVYVLLGCSVLDLLTTYHFHLPLTICHSLLISKCTPESLSASTASTYTASSSTYFGVRAGTLARSDHYLLTTIYSRMTVHYLLVSAHPRVRIGEHRQQLCDVHGELGSWQPRLGEGWVRVGYLCEGSWQPRLGWGEGWVFV